MSDSTTSTPAATGDGLTQAEATDGVAQTDPIVAAADPETDSAAGPVDQADAPEDEPDAEHTGNREAKYRTERNEARAERDAIADQLAAQRRAVVDWRAANAPTGAVDPALLDAAGIDVDTLLDDKGHLDMTRVDEFVDATAKRFKIARSFAPNRAQGQSGTGTDNAPKKSLADAFRQ